MAIVVRRYALRGPTNSDLSTFVGSGAVVSTTFPTTTIDVSIDNAIAGAIEDLDTYMTGRGFEFIAADVPIRAFDVAPPAPTSGVNVASQLRAGRSMLSQRGPVGALYQLQPALFGNKAALWTAQGNGTNVTLIGFGNSTTGTAQTRNVATTNFSSQQRRLAYQSQNSAGSSCGTRHAALQFWRGNAANRGGFFYVARFVLDTVTAAFRWFVGFTDFTTVISSVNPSTLLNMVGFGIDSGQANVRFFHNDAAGTATAIDLGASFPAGTVGAVYEARIYCAPNGATIGYSLERLDVAAFTEGSVNADIPANTVLLSPHMWMNNGGVAGQVVLAVISQYLETDF